MNKLKLYENESKTYIVDGKNMWVYDGKEIKKSIYSPNIEDETKKQQGKQ